MVDIPLMQKRFNTQINYFVISTSGINTPNMRFVRCLPNDISNISRQNIYRDRKYGKIACTNLQTSFSQSFVFRVKPFYNAIPQLLTTSHKWNWAIFRAFKDYQW